MILTQEELLEEVKGKDEDDKSKAQVTVGITLKNILKAAGL